MHLDTRHHADAADIGDHRMVTERKYRFKEIVLEIGGIFEQPVGFIDFLGGDSRGAGGRMGRVGVAVEEFDPVAGRGIHDRVVDFVGNRDAAHRDGAIGDRLRHRDDVGLDVELLRREGRPHASEPCDDLVEHEKHAVLVADLAYFLKVALRRHQCSGRTGHRLDEYRGERCAAEILGDPLQIHCQFGAGLRLAL